MIIGYSSAYLTHLDRLKRDEKERFSGIPPFMALLIAAAALHVGMLLPWMAMKHNAPLPDTRQVHLTFGKKTGEYGGPASPSGSGPARTIPSNEAISSMDRMFSPPPPVKVAPPLPAPSPLATAALVSKASDAATATLSNIEQHTPPTSSLYPTGPALRHAISRSRLGGSGEAGSDSKGTEGNGAGIGEGGDGGTDSAAREVISKYEQLLSGWIDRHKIYPASALKQGMEGKVVLRLRIRRNGEVVRSGIERSSGYSLLDQAVLETVTRSAPMPAVPAEYPGGAQLEFLIPIRFSVK